MTPTATHAAPLADVVQRCRREQYAWAALPVRQRLRPVRAFRHLLAGDCASLCAAVARDLGKSPEETIAGDLLPLADACRFLEREAVRLLRPRRIATWLRPLYLWGQSDTLHRRPRGVIGLIGTWNYPLLLNGIGLMQGLTAGNGVVWKPSEVAPASAAALFRLLERAGFPAGLVQMLEPTRAAGEELANADVDHVAFTGSAATGRILAAHLGGRLVSSTLELSGCDALFVLEDADVPLAARAAWFGATLNRGQTCIAVRRAFVQRSQYPAFIEALKPLVEAAGPLPLAMEKQVRHAERLLSEAVNGGGQLLQGGAFVAADASTNLCRPTVVLDATPEMALCREDSFAPVLAVLPFDTTADALRMDAACRYGLGASLFTRDPARAARLAAHLRVGMVAVNETIVPTAHPATPFGGRGLSGWGVTQGAEGLLEMTVPQVVSVCSGFFRPHYDLAAGRRMTRGGLLHGMLQWRHGATLRQRWGGLVRLVRALWHGPDAGANP